MHTLTGRNALVTGASSGIGAATARALAAQGARVALAARRTDRLAVLAEDIVGAGGYAIAIALDVADPASCAQAVADTVTALGGLDILVNAAGLMLLGPINAADTSDWHRSIDTNVLGLMHITHAALPHLLRTTTSPSAPYAQAVKDIVNISSVAGRVAGAGSGVYNASKWAVNAFSESLRQEVTQQGVRVSVMEPGAVDTELTQHITDPDSKAATETFYGQMRNLKPDDIANAIIFIVSQPAHVAINELLVRPTDQV